MTSNISFKSMLKGGSVIIAGSDSTIGLFYSEDNGKTWKNSFDNLTIIGSMIIAGSSAVGFYYGHGLLYSEDNGKTWKQSNIDIGGFSSLTTINSTVIAGSCYDNGLLYSEDNGKTWKHSNITTGDFECLTVIGNTVIAGSWTIFDSFKITRRGFNKGLYYSEDNGKTWNLSNIDAGNFYSLIVIDDTVIASSDFGLLYSEDKGKTWKESNINTGIFSCLTTIGNTIIAGSGEISGEGLYYSEDKGHTWYRSNINTDRFKCLTVIGNTVIAGSYSRNKGRGLYYSDDNGKTWIQSNINIGRFWCLLTDGSKVFASGSYNTKDCLYYSEDNGHTWRNYNDIIEDDKVNDKVNDKEVCDSNMSKEIETTQKVQLIFEFDKNGDVVFNDGVCTTIEKEMASIKFNCNGYDLAKRIALNLLGSLPLVIDIVNLNNDELGKNIISFSIGFSHEYVYHKYTILITKPSIEVHIKESDKYIKWVTSVNNIILFDDFSKIVKNYSVKGDFKEYNINSKPKVVEQYYAFDDGNNIEVKHQYLLSEIINHCSNILYDHFYQKYCSK